VISLSSFLVKVNNSRYRTTPRTIIATPAMVLSVIPVARPTINVKTPNAAINMAAALEIGLTRIATTQGIIS
jgi:hypothetical protein